MKNKKKQAIILRTGLALTMFLGSGLLANQVSAAEDLEESVDKEKLSIEIQSESINARVNETVEELEDTNVLDETELSLDETMEQTDVSTETNLDLEDENELTDKKLEEIEEVEDNIDEETLTDEVSNEEDSILEEELIEGKIDPENTLEPELPEKETEGLSEDETSAESPSEIESKTMSASVGNSDKEVDVDRIHGQNRFKNAVEISKKGWTTAPKVFLANGYKFADSLTGSPLAALNNAPILLTRDNFLPEETLAELKRLNAKEVVILGGELSIPKHIVTTLQQNGFKVTRIGGNNRYNQAELVANEIMKIEGKNRDAFLASGEVFPDALSIATVASTKRLPIFLTRGNRLDQSVINAVPYINSWTIIGGPLTITKSVENELKNAGAKVSRIEGRTRYDVNRNVLNYYGVPKEHLYVTSGEHYSDTLPASVLAAKEKSGILLLRNDNKTTNDEQKIFAQNKHKVRDYTFIGGPLTLSENTKKDFKELILTVDASMLDAIKRQFSGYSFSQYDLTLSEALNMQMLVTPQTDKKYSAFVSKEYIDANNLVTSDMINVRIGAGSNYHIMATLKKGTKVNIISEKNGWYQIDLNQRWVNASSSDVNYYLNPNNFVLSDTQKFQFLDLTKTSNVTAAQLNKFLVGKGILEGKGQAFIDAGKKHGINEVYLLSHALLETGHGTSKLANGVQMNGNKAYNMYGIGAYDSDPLKYGSERAYEEKWFTPEEAIIGGAAFIGTNYVKAGQNTLYKMRWNPETMDTHGYASHQYATDIGWAYKQVSTIQNLYKSIGIDVKHVDIPVYLA